jgi:hypothetical protein
VLAGDLQNSSDKRNAAHAHLTLVDADFHKKECVQSTEAFTGQTSEVMFLQCHGIERNEEKQHPCSGLIFRCSRNKVTEMEMTKTVWTRPPLNMQEAVTLHEVVRGCQLAIALACTGNQLKEDYLKVVGGKKFPDMLICNTDEIHSDTIEIFTVLLINMLDSKMEKYNPGPGEVYREVKEAIIRIFQIVQVFKDQPTEFKDQPTEVRRWARTKMLEHGQNRTRRGCAY